MEVVATSLIALANFRRGQMDYWLAKYSGRLAEGESLHEVQREAQ